MDEQIPKSYHGHGRVLDVACSLLFVGIATIQMMPVSPLRQIPAGTETSATVPFFNLWTLTHNTDFISQGAAGRYWSAPFFHPEDEVFALSEAQPPLLLLTPFAAVVSPTFAYNLFVFANLILNGIFGFRLMRQSAGSGRVAALFCGCGLQLLPFINLQLGVLQLIAIWPFILLLQSCQDLVTRFSIGGSVRAGVTLGVTYLFCNNYGLMSAIILTMVFAPLMIRRHTAIECLKVLAIAGLCFAAVAGWVVLKQLSVLSASEYQRDTETVASLSAQIADLAVNPWSHRLSISGLSSSRSRPLWGLSCGFGNYLMAVGGVAIGLRIARLRRWTLTLAAVLVIAAAFAILPGEGAAGGEMHAWLCQIIPGLKQIRSVYRFLLYFQIATVLLAATFIEGCDAELRSNSSTLSRRAKALIVGSLAALVGVATFEIVPERTYVCSAPWQTDQPFCQWIRKNTVQDEVLACFPFPAGTEASDYQHEVAWMFAARFHQRKIINGYSGFFPKDYVRMKDDATLPLSEEMATRLRSAGVGHILIHEDWYRVIHGVEVDREGSALLQEVHFDPENSVRIYRLKP